MKNQSDFLAPTFPHTLTCPTTTTIRLTEYSLLLFFPDCNASVHKGCRDSLAVCAKVKMKVQLPRSYSSTDSVVLCCPEANIDFLFIYAFSHRFSA